MSDAKPRGATVKEQPMPLDQKPAKTAYVFREHWQVSVSGQSTLEDAHLIPDKM